MKATIENVRIAATNSYNLVNKNTKMSERVSILKHQLIDVGIKESDIFLVGEKPAKGAVFSVIELKDRFRVNYRCGYSRNNYAPCVEIKKNL